MDTGGTLEGVNLETGIICQDLILPILPVNLGFEEGIFKIGIPVLNDIIEQTKIGRCLQGHIVWQQDGSELFDFVGVVGGKQ